MSEDAWHDEHTLQQVVQTFATERGVLCQIRTHWTVGVDAECSQGVLPHAH